MDTKKPERTITITCPSCKRTHVVPISRVRKSWTGEYFFACTTVIGCSYSRNKKIYCNAYLEIPAELIEGARSEESTDLDEK